MQKLSNLLVGHFAFQALKAVEKAKVLELLEKNPIGLSSKYIASNLRLNHLILESLLDFLVINVSDYFRKNDGLYSLTPAFRSDAFQNTFLFALAYDPVIKEVDALLQQKKVYDVDVVRDGEYLARSSAIHNKRVKEAVIGLLKEIDVEVVIDLGCGVGDFLVMVKEAVPHVDTVGVERDQNAVRAARETFPGIVVIEGDATRPTQWFEMVKRYDPRRVAIVGITLWHECLVDGSFEFKRIISEYGTLFPGAYFMIIEKNGYPVEALELLPESLRDFSSAYQFVHPMTQQGMPMSPAQWADLLEDTDLVLEKVTACAPDMTVYTGILS